MVLRKLLTNHWIAWTGVPKEIILDPAQTNLGENLVGPCELEGSQIRPIVAGAQWQLGKTESMAVGSLMFWTRSLRNINLRIKRSGFCVQHAHVKNQMIQVHCFLHISSFLAVVCTFLKIS